MNPSQDQKPKGPPSLHDFFDDKEALKAIHPALLDIDHNTLMAFAGKCINVNHTYYKHKFTDCCSICDELLTPFDKSLMKPTDIIFVCKKHRKSSMCAQVDMERKRLGYEPRKMW